MADIVTPSKVALIATSLRDERQSIAIQVKREAFRFTSYQNWVNKASIWYLTYRPLDRKKLIAVDAVGRVCWIGSDFMQARDENALPIVVYEI